MSAKRALIVDDSKSARLFLARVLQDFEIDVGIGKEFTDGGSTRTSVRHTDHRNGIKATLDGPTMPDPCHRGSGIDEYTVHVKQQSTAADCNHFI